MGVSKKERAIIFNKFRGRCAYCGCELEKSWHVDELLPCRRRYKIIKGTWSEGWVRTMTEEEMFAAGIRWIPERTVPDGYDNPENLHIDNQMPACGSCNITKSSMSLESFRETVAGFISSLNNYTSIYRVAKRFALLEETGIPVVFHFEKFDKNE